MSADRTRNTILDRSEDKCRHKAEPCQHARSLPDGALNTQCTQIRPPRSFKGAHPPTLQTAKKVDRRPPTPRAKGEGRWAMGEGRWAMGEDADRRPPTLGEISSQPPLCTWIKAPRRSKNVRPTDEHKSNRRGDQKGGACPPALTENIDRLKPPQTSTGACAPHRTGAR